jgi:hypothetical protein
MTKGACAQKAPPRVATSPSSEAAVPPVLTVTKIAHITGDQGSRLIRSGSPPNEQVVGDVAMNHERRVAREGVVADRSPRKRTRTASRATRAASSPAVATDN